MPFKGAIFDLDGVLVDTVPLHYAAWERMFGEYGYAFDEKIYREKVDGRPRMDGVRGVMVDADPVTADEAASRKQGYYLDMIEQGRLRIFESSLALVAGLKARGVIMAAASSSRNAPAILERIGIDQDFGAIITADHISHGKPHPEIFLTAAKRIGLEPSECVVFEDAESGVVAARRGGFFCVGIDRHCHPGYFAEADMVLPALEMSAVLHLFAGGEPAAGAPATPPDTTLPAL